MKIFLVKQSVFSLGLASFVCLIPVLCLKWQLSDTISQFWKNQILFIANQVNPCTSIGPIKEWKKKRYQVRLCKSGFKYCECKKCWWCKLSTIKGRMNWTVVEWCPKDAYGYCELLLISENWIFLNFA